MHTFQTCFKRTKKSVKGVVKMNRIKMERLRRLWADGMEPQEICKHLGMNDKKVYIAIAIIELLMQATLTRL